MKSYLVLFQCAKCKTVLWESAANLDGDQLPPKDSPRCPQCDSYQTVRVKRADGGVLLPVLEVDH